MTGGVGQQILQQNPLSRIAPNNTPGNVTSSAPAAYGVDQRSFTTTTTTYDKTAGVPATQQYEDYISSVMRQTYTSGGQSSALTAQLPSSGMQGGAQYSSMAQSGGAQQSILQQAPLGGLQVAAGAQFPSASSSQVQGQSAVYSTTSGVAQRQGAQGGYSTTNQMQAGGQYSSATGGVQYSSTSMISPSPSGPAQYSTTSGGVEYNGHGSTQQQYTNTVATTTATTTTTTGTTGQGGQYTSQYATSTNKNKDRPMEGTMVPLNSLANQRYEERHASVAGRSDTSSVIRREYGEQRLISTTERVDESRSRIVNESEVVHTIMVPRKIVREEVIEKHIVVPETIRHEEIIDEEHLVKEKVIEVTKPIIVHKIIEVPEIEYVEEPPETIVKYENREKVIHKVVPRKKVVERELPRETIDKVVENPPPPAEVIDVVEERQVNYDIHRNLPIPIQSEVTYEFRKPNLKPTYDKFSFQVFIPRFIEIPVVAELLTAQQKALALRQISEVESLTKNAASLCEIEATAARLKSVGLAAQVQKVDLRESLVSAWRSDRLGVGA